MPARTPAALAAQRSTPPPGLRLALFTTLLLALAGALLAGPAAAVPAASPSTAPVVPGVTDAARAPRAAQLRRGSRGAPVRELQRELNRRGARPRLSVDGAFGRATTTAVRALQLRLERRPTGVAGAALLRHLGLVPAVTAGSTALREPVGAAPPADLARGQVLVPLARTQIGAPYVSGGKSPSGFDCSGLMYWLYGHLSIELPRTTWEQFAAFPKVTRADLAPGDIVFFNGLGHNGLYIGAGSFIHAPNSGRSVQINQLTDHWYRDRYDGAVRPG